MGNKIPRFRRVSRDLWNHIEIPTKVQVWDKKTYSQKNEIVFSENNDKSVKTPNGLTKYP